MDIKLHYTEQGSGFPLILLHGNGEDHTYFVHQIEFFSRFYRVIALDTRGHGQSPRGTAPFSIVQFAKDLLAFMDQKQIKKTHILGFSDGGFYNPGDLTSEVAKVIGDFRPDMVFAPDPCVSAEGHADHLNVGEAVRRLLVFTSHGGIMGKLGASRARVKAAAFYMIAKVNQYVGTRGYLNRQLEAIFSCHTSQFPAGNADGKRIAMYIKLRAIDFGIRSFKGCAEGFRVLGQVHMHCLPEAK